MVLLEMPFWWWWELNLHQGWGWTGDAVTWHVVVA